MTGFGPEHLPYGVFRRAGESPRVGARLGDGVLDLAALATDGPLDEDPALFAQPSLNAFMAAGRETWARVREALRSLAAGPDAEPATVALADVELLLPIAVGDYVDFYSSLDHATNVGRLFRPDADPLLPNWRHLPVGYHGRAGTVVVSGTPIRRPRGQRREPGADAPVFGPSARLDIELELGFVIGAPSALGEPVAVDARARPRLRRRCWSTTGARATCRPGSTARSGPFLAKSFATSVAAWVTPLDAVLDRRVAAPAQEPAPLTYLREDPWALDLDLEIELNGSVIARTSARHLYWSAAQQLAHLTVNGASLRVGDLLASGTISGPERGQRGSLLELAWNGARADRARRRVDAQLPARRRRGRPARGRRRRARPRRGPRTDRAGGLMALPKAIRRLAPDRLRDDVRLRSVFVGAGLIPPRTMHSDDDAAVLRATATGRRRVVELGVYEGSSAVVLCEVLDAGAELHLVDPFGHHGWALPAGWGATEGASRRVVARAARRHAGPRVTWHVDYSSAVARRWEGAVDLVFIDGDHSEEGVRTDWEDWHAFVEPGGRCCSTTRGCRRRAGAGSRARRRWSTRSSAGPEPSTGGAWRARPIARSRSSATRNRRRAARAPREGSRQRAGGRRGDVERRSSPLRRG